MLSIKRLYIILVVALIPVHCNNDLLLTESQRDALVKFKAQVIDLIPPQNVYMTKDAYLVKWLRAARFDVKTARHNFRQNLRWRDEHDMDTILNADFSDVIMNYRILDPDEKGRPVLLIRIGSWDISNSASNGNRDRFEDAVFRMLEDVNLRVVKLQAAGNPITRYSVIVDLHGFSLSRHACFPCIPVYTSLVLGLDEHFPQSVGRAAFINTPRIFEFVLNVIKSAMSQELKGVLEVYGPNRRTWPADLTKYAVLENRPVFNFNLQNPAAFPQVQVVPPGQLPPPQQQQRQPSSSQYRIRNRQQPTTPAAQNQYQQFQQTSQQQQQQNYYLPPQEQFQRPRFPQQAQNQPIQNQYQPSLSNPNRIRYKIPSRSPVTTNPFSNEDEY